MTLHLVRMPLDLAALARAAGDRGWTRGRTAAFDEGAALHHLLGETFGDAALQPFRAMIAPGARRGTLYAYTSAPADELRETAALAATPEAEAALSTAAMLSKPMPDVAARGRRVGFDLRLRPTVRLLRDISAPSERADGRRHGFARGAEVDVFLAKALRHDDRGTMADAGQTREVVYRYWLAARLGEAAKLEDARMVSMRRTKAARGGATSEAPDVVMQGTLVVGEQARFADLLRRGVGRHKAYGYGMMLLRPPGTAVPKG